MAYLYGESIRHTDGVLGRLFDDLRTLGVWDELLVVITSDHGEMLLEAPGETLHGVHQPGVLRVPLLIKWPATSAGARRAGLVRPEPVSALDIMPTVLAAAGLETGDLPGVDLSRRLAPDRSLIAGTETISLIDGSEMLVREADGRLRLIDLDSGIAALGLPRDDGDRLADLVARLDGALSRIAQRRARFDRDGKPTSPPLTEEERERLRGFGYTDS